MSISTKSESHRCTLVSDMIWHIFTHLECYPTQAIQNTDEFLCLYYPSPQISRDLSLFCHNPAGGPQSIPLINPPPGGQKTALGGFLAALDMDGKILWESANPYPAILPALYGSSPLAAMNVGPLTVANNVVYWPSYDINGHLMFVDARTGEHLGNFATGVPIGSLEGGAAVVDGSVYVGSGYGAFAGFPSITWFVWGLTLPR
jgi:hypothetical protein